MKKILLLTLITVSTLFTNRLFAQSYPVAVGAKFGGYENGLSVKYFMQKNAALEGILGFRSHGVVLTGLYEIHQTAFNVPELKFYYGGGAHIGSINGDYSRFGSDSQKYNGSTLLLGADGVIGLEYKIPNAPIAISLDLNPRLELATGPFFDLAPGLGLKYTF
ncbi:hypothetical protein KXQ82_02810 [Mucilaginibacter sp. HMF5004]|uniref:hypothetical protein n=1 Tax=Mucilaginibacter rivuli TaxID=2857527 RepID=UPI001C5FD289|nr:hypothetical protein [Mucilaginibacter rivuli]MBW4888624.1 hypothetical protein [Mucilaginibacter rivuli]